MRKIDISKVRPGDIILTASHGKLSKSIRFATNGLVSHAMICVQYGSAIDSTNVGVQAWNLQRSFLDDGEEAFVFRLKRQPSEKTLAAVIDFARSEIGKRYSKTEAARAVFPVPKLRNNRQFCSRLVARAYKHAGIELVADADYCSPEDLRRSELLVEITDCVLEADVEEVAARSSEFNPVEEMQIAQNFVLRTARQLDSSVENFEDLDRLVTEHAEWDDVIAEAYMKSGYLELWRHELLMHPWRYDVHAMQEFTIESRIADLRAYCIDTITEAYSGGLRFAVNLAHYEARNLTDPRKTLGLLISLYETLVQNDEDRRNVACDWLAERFPDDLVNHLEWITPHGDLWFFIVERVEPQLANLARFAISNEQSSEVCSSCGDKPTSDYRIVNSATAMPGVPSLRLCADCAAIRSGFGEKLSRMIV